MADRSVIPAKQLHQFGTLLELQANLSNREIGFCTEDKVCYMKFDDVLFPMGQGFIDAPTQTSLFMSYEDPNHPGKYIYGWVKFTDKTAPYDSNIILWSRIAGKGLFADTADKDTSGRSISDLLDLVEFPDELPVEDSDALVTSGGVFAALVFLNESVSDSIGLLRDNVYESLDGKVDRTNVAPGTYTKVTVNQQGAVTQGGGLEAEDIPNIPAEKLTSGELPPDRIGDGSIIPEKLESLKRLMVDGRTITATEENGVVIIHAVTDYVEGLARGDIGSYDITKDIHKIIAGRDTDKSLAIHIDRDNNNGGALSINIDATDNDWLVGATGLCMVCSGRARQCMSIDDGGSDTYKQTSGVLGSAVVSNTHYSQKLVFYESTSIPTTYGAVLDIYITFVVDTIRYVAQFNVAVYNVGARDSSDEVFMAKGDLWKVLGT